MQTANMLASASSSAASSSLRGHVAAFGRRCGSKSKVFSDCDAGLLLLRVRARAPPGGAQGAARAGGTLSAGGFVSLARRPSERRANWPRAGAAALARRPPPKQTRQSRPAAAAATTIRRARSAIECSGRALVAQRGGAAAARHSPPRRHAEPIVAPRQIRFVVLAAGAAAVAFGGRRRDAAGAVRVADWLFLTPSPCAASAQPRGRRRHKGRRALHKAAASALT